MSIFLWLVLAVVVLVGVFVPKNRLAWTLFTAALGIIIAMGLFAPGGWYIVLTFFLIIFFSGFVTVPEQERWVIEFFGAYIYTLKPGLGWLLGKSFVMRVRERVDVRIRRIPLFGNGTIKLDFPDVSATLTGVEGFVKVYKPDEAYTTNSGGSAYTGAWRAAYSGAENDKLIRDILESALRTFLSLSPSFDEANKKGGSGFNLAAIGDKGIPDDDLKTLEDRLHELGHTILEGGSLTIEDFGLDEVVTQGRQKIAVQKARADAAEHSARATATESMGALLRSLAQSLGLDRDSEGKLLEDGGVAKVQAVLKERPDLEAQVQLFAVEAITQQLSLQEGALDHIKVSGVSGEFAGLIGLVRALKEVFPGASGKSGNEGSQGSSGPVRAKRTPSGPIDYEAAHRRTKY